MTVTAARAALLLRMASVLLAAVAAPLPAAAFPDYVGTRATSMGGAGRADARANQGPLLNPAGMSLAKVFTLEAGYQFITRDGGHLFNASVVDTTSGWQLGGGLYYSHRRISPSGVPRLSAHEVGVALSYPFGNRVMIGATGKYFRLSGGPGEPDGSASDGGITVDAGVAVQVAPILTLGAVGYNLRDLGTVQAPVALGYGLALAPVPTLVVAFDLLHDFTTNDPSRGTRVTAAGGAELLLGGRLALRAGGGRDGGSGHGYVSAGVAGVSEAGTLDAGVRQDVSGDRKLTFLLVSARLFVPQ
jgi:hypothetical protein